MHQNVLASAKLMALLSQKYWMGASNRFADCGCVTGGYYAQLKLRIPSPASKRTSACLSKTKMASPVQTVAQAVAELNRLQTQRSDNTLPMLARTPNLRILARYLAFISSGQGTKKPGTMQKEKAILARWTDYIGKLRLDQIKRVHVNRFIESRLKQNVSPRTINLDVIAMRVVFKRALEDGLIQRLPTEGCAAQNQHARNARLFTSDRFGKLCQRAFEHKMEETRKVPVTENAPGICGLHQGARLLRRSSQ